MRPGSEMCGRRFVSESGFWLAQAAAIAKRQKVKIRKDGVDSCGCHYHFRACRIPAEGCAIEDNPGRLMKTTYTIDPAHSSAQFTVRHMMISNVRGGFSSVKGTVEYDAGESGTTLPSTS